MVATPILSTKLESRLDGVDVMRSDNTMYVCQKKSTDGGKTWGPLMFPFGRDVANREASPVYDEVHHKLIVVGNLMDQQLIMVAFLPLSHPDHIG